MGSSALFVIKKGYLEEGRWLNHGPACTSKDVIWRLSEHALGAQLCLISSISVSPGRFIGYGFLWIILWMALVF